MRLSRTSPPRAGFSCLAASPGAQALEQAFQRRLALGPAQYRHQLAVEGQRTQFDHAHAGRPLQPQAGTRDQRHAEAALDHAHDGFQLIQLQRLAHAQALFAEKLADPPTTEGAAVIAHEGLFGEQAQRLIALDLQRRDQHEGFARQADLLQFLGQLERRFDQQGQVQLAGIHLAQQLQRHAGHQLQLDPRRGRAKAWQGVGQQAGLYRGDGAYAQLALPLGSRGRQSHLRIQLEDLLGQRQGMPAGGVEHRGAAAAIEQAHTEALLQHAHLRADRRLGQADVLAGGGEGAVAGDHHQGFQLAQHERLD